MTNHTSSPHHDTTPSTTDVKLGGDDRISIPITPELLNDILRHVDGGLCLNDAELHVLREAFSEFSAAESLYQGVFVDTLHRMEAIRDSEGMMAIAFLLWCFDRPQLRIGREAVADMMFGAIQDFNRARDAFKLDLRKSMPYRDYLRTKHWRSVRQRAIESANYRCQLCNSDRSLHVHHRTYERRGEELASDVIVLCAECHEHFHNGRKVARP